MATVTTPRKQLPGLPSSRSQTEPESVVVETTRPYFGERVAFVIWITCFLFMSSLLTYDVVMGLFR
jgi:hypothetical protein